MFFIPTDDVLHVGAEHAILRFASCTRIPIRKGLRVFTPPVGRADENGQLIEPHLMDAPVGVVFQEVIPPFSLPPFKVRPGGFLPVPDPVEAQIFCLQTLVFHFGHMNPETGIRVTLPVVSRFHQAGNGPLIKETDPLSVPFYIGFDPVDVVGADVFRFGEVHLPF